MGKIYFIHVFTDMTGVKVRFSICSFAFPPVNIHIELFEHRPFVLFCQIYLRMDLTLLHSERPKLYAILVFLSAVGLNYIMMNPSCATLCRSTTACAPNHGHAVFPGS